MNLKEALRRLEEVETQRNTIQQERDELKGHLARLAAELELFHQHGWKRPDLLAQPAGHFYSPVVDPESDFVTRALADTTPPAAIEIDDDKMLEELEALAKFYPDMPFGPTKTDGLRFFFENPAFSYTDALVLYAYIRKLRPKRIVEIGCGYSTCVIFDTIDRFVSPAPEIRCFDPYPDVPLQLTAPDDHLRKAITAIPLQDIPNEVFSSLEAGDILFIDSSHIAKTGSDVLDYLFRALPLVKPGVYIHIHDIGAHFEYSHEWVVTENRSWNEIYFLRAFLMYNEAFKIVFWNNHVVRKFPERVEALAPLCLKNGGASIWLVRT
jgi:hypothetical protein